MKIGFGGGVEVCGAEGCQEVIVSNGLPCWGLVVDRPGSGHGFEYHQLVCNIYRWCKIVEVVQKPYVRLVKVQLWRPCRDICFGCLWCGVIGYKYSGPICGPLGLGENVMPLDVIPLRSISLLKSIVRVIWWHE